MDRWSELIAPKESWLDGPANAPLAVIESGLMGFPQPVYRHFASGMDNSIQMTSFVLVIEIVDDRIFDVAQKPFTIHFS